MMTPTAGALRAGGCRAPAQPPRQAAARGNALHTSLLRSAAPAPRRTRPTTGGAPQQRRPPHATSDLRSEAERFVEEIERAAAAEEAVAAAGGASASAAAAARSAASLQGQLDAARRALTALDGEVDALYGAAFVGVQVTVPAAAAGGGGGGGGEGGLPPPPRAWACEAMDEAAFGRLGRDDPELLRALLGATERRDAAGWQRFQAAVSDAKLRRSRVAQEAAQLADALTSAERDGATAAARGAAAAAAETAAAASAASTSGRAARAAPPPAGGLRPVTIVLMTGFEAFNAGLYQQVAAALRRRMPHVDLRVFSDRDIEPRRGEIEAALQARGLLGRRARGARASAVEGGQHGVQAPRSSAPAAICFHCTAA